jgi:HAD superfamily hydrolase (TIGR01509 family)
VTALAGLIFDVDGTISETEEVHRRAFNEAFAAMRLQERVPDGRHAWVWQRPLYAALLKTTGGKERIAAYLRDHLGVDPAPFAALIAELHAAKTKRYTDIVATEGLALRPGIAALIAEARRRKLALAIATTTSRPNVEALSLSAFGKPALEVFDVVAAGDEVAAKKPAPDVYILALERLGLPASACIAFEDSRNGLLAAKASGLRCIVSPSVYTSSEDLAAADHLLPEFDAAVGLIEALTAR